MTTQGPTVGSTPNVWNGSANSAAAGPSVGDDVGVQLNATRDSNVVVSQAQTGTHDLDYFSNEDEDGDETGSTNCDTFTRKLHVERKSICC